MHSTIPENIPMTVQYTPLMLWSQTPTHVSVQVAVRNTTLEPSIQIECEKLFLEVHTQDAKYIVDAPWYDKISSENSSWKTGNNGNILISIKKASETEWIHPFANKVYKGFVKIDWARWTNYDSENSECEDEQDLPPYDFSSLQQASTTDFGGDAQNLPNENNTDFQNMMTGLERLGTDKDIQLPSIDELNDNMSKEDIQDLLRSCDEEGCSEVNLDKVQREVDVPCDDIDHIDKHELVDGTTQNVCSS